MLRHAFLEFICHRGRKQYSFAKHVIGFLNAPIWALILYSEHTANISITHFCHPRIIFKTYCLLWCCSPASRHRQWWVSEDNRKYYLGLRAIKISAYHVVGKMSLERLTTVHWMFIKNISHLLYIVSTAALFDRRSESLSNTLLTKKLHGVQEVPRIGFRS